MSVSLTGTNANPSAWIALNLNIYHPILAC
jgi:hypothetical protein